MTAQGATLFRTALLQLTMFYSLLPDAPETLSPEEAEARAQLLLMCGVILDEA
jgi:hypothetical protein